MKLNTYPDIKTDTTKQHDRSKKLPFKVSESIKDHYKSKFAEKQCLMSCDRLLLILDEADNYLYHLIEKKKNHLDFLHLITYQKCIHAMIMRINLFKTLINQKITINRELIDHLQNYLLSLQIANQDIHIKRTSEFIVNSLSHHFFEIFQQNISSLQCFRKETVEIRTMKHDTTHRMDKMFDKLKNLKIQTTTKLPLKKHKPRKIKKPSLNTNKRQASII